MHRTIVAGFLVLALGGLWGCGSKSPGVADGTTKVNGTVKFAGKPLTYGTVQFHMAGGRVLKAAIGPDGSYSMFQPPTGDGKVIVVPGNPPVAAAAMGGGNEPPPKFDKVTIPAKYQDVEKTTLTCTIKDGPQTIDVIVPEE